MEILPYILIALVGLISGILSGMTGGGGAEALSDYELLMAIIGSGTAQADVTKIARDVLTILKRDRILTMDAVDQVKASGCRGEIGQLAAIYELELKNLLGSERRILGSI